MPKRLSIEAHDQKPVQIDASSKNAKEENTNSMIEMAAEQLADLLWRHWLYMQKQKKKKRLNVPDS